ncbi:hypothetical protein F2P56_035745, partial [Juglans regia]
HQSPLSFSSPKPPLSLISLVFSLPRRSLSTAASSPPTTHVSVHHNSSQYGYAGGIGVSGDGSKVLLKGMKYSELENWVQLQGYRPGQALMLWKRLYGNNIWAHHIDELEGLNKDFKKMLCENAEFKVLSLKEILTACDGTRKEVADIIYIGR